MGYIKKSLQLINKKLDEGTELPVKWDEFIKDASKSENILIKSKNKHLYCTNCKKEYKYSHKLKQVLKCPFCHQELEVKNWNIKNLTYKKNLILVERVNEEYILRIFELRSIYSDKDFERTVVEYGRHFINENLDCIRQNVCSAMGSYHVNHNIDMAYSVKKWRSLDSYWKSLSTSGKVYHYNLKEIFKNTPYQYSQVWELAKHMNYVDIGRIIRYEISYKSFELLVKAKLYKLACTAREYFKTGTFENRFGVSKEFYPFMKKHNIDGKELERLRLLKQADIKKVKYLTQYSVDTLEDIQKYINLDKFITYSKKIKHFDIYTFRDYLRFCKSLGFNMKDKKILFPRTGNELNKKHDELEKQYEIKKDELLNKNIKKRFNNLKVNEYQSGGFIIKPADNMKSLVDESKQQNNCVRTYAEDYANSKCDIYFMRLVKNPKKSLVTVEVRNNKVVQSRIKNNQSPTKLQLDFLNKWELTILSKGQKVDI